MVDVNKSHASVFSFSNFGFTAPAAPERLFSQGEIEALLDAIPDCLARNDQRTLSLIFRKTIDFYFTQRKAPEGLARIRQSIEAYAAGKERAPLYVAIARFANAARDFEPNFFATCYLRQLSYDYYLEAANLYDRHPGTAALADDLRQQAVGQINAITIGIAASADSSFWYANPQHALPKTILGHLFAWVLVNP